MPSNSATALAVRSAAIIPARPVQALALPELAMMALARPRFFFKCSRQRSTGAAAARFVVKTPAALAPGASHTISARSSAPAVFLIPAAAAAARKPFGVAILPSMAFHVGIDQTDSSFG